MLVTPHTHSVKCVCSSDDGRFVATGSYNGRVTIYDRRESRWCADERLTIAGVSSLAYDLNAGLFLASSYDGRVYQVAAQATR